MYLRIDENPNCEPVERVFQERSEPRIVIGVLRMRDGQERWCSITGLDENGKTIPAQARKIDDSGEGTCYMVTGGAWGLRLRDPSGVEWGEAFLLLPADGADLRFAEAS